MRWIVLFLLVVQLIGGTVLIAQGRNQRNSRHGRSGRPDRLQQAEFVPPNSTIDDILQPRSSDKPHVVRFVDEFYLHLKKYKSSIRDLEPSFADEWLVMARYLANRRALYNVECASLPFSDFVWIKNPDIARFRNVIEQARQLNWPSCSRRPNTTIVAVAVAKDEGTLIQEWLMWNLLAGIDHFYISIEVPMTDNTESALDPFIQAGYVTLLTYPVYFDANFQLNAYNKVLRLLRKKYCQNELCEPGRVWISTQDLDEFLRYAPYHNGTCLHDFLNRYSGYGSLDIPVVSFGSENFLMQPCGVPVTTAYKHRLEQTQLSKKVIANLAYADRYIDPHFVLLLDNAKVVTENFDRLRPRHSIQSELSGKNPDEFQLILYHYQSRSIEHVFERWVRGRGFSSHDQPLWPQNRMLETVPGAIGRRHSPIEDYFAPAIALAVHKLLLICSQLG